MPARTFEFLAGFASLVLSYPISEGEARVGCGMGKRQVRKDNRLNGNDADSGGEITYLGWPENHPSTFVGHALDGCQSHQAGLGLLCLQLGAEIGRWSG